MDHETNDNAATNNNGSRTHIGGAAAAAAAPHEEHEEEPEEQGATEDGIYVGLDDLVQQVNENGSPRKGNTTNRAAVVEIMEEEEVHNVVWLSTNSSNADASETLPEQEEEQQQQQQQPKQPPEATKVVTAAAYTAFSPPPIATSDVNQTTFSMDSTRNGSRDGSSFEQDDDDDDDDGDCRRIIASLPTLEIQENDSNVVDPEKEVTVAIDDDEDNDDINDAFDIDIYQQNTDVGIIQVESSSSSIQLLETYTASLVTAEFQVKPSPFSAASSCSTSIFANDHYPHDTHDDDDTDDDADGDDTDDDDHDDDAAVTTPASCSSTDAAAPTFVPQSFHAPQPQQTPLVVSRSVPSSAEATVEAEASAMDTTTYMVTTTADDDDSDDDIDAELARLEQELLSELGQTPHTTLSSAASDTGTTSPPPPPTMSPLPPAATINDNTSSTTPEPAASHQPPSLASSATGADDAAAAVDDDAPDIIGEAPPVSAILLFEHQPDPEQSAPAAADTITSSIDNDDDDSLDNVRIIVTKKSSNDGVDGVNDDDDLNDKRIPQQEPGSTTDPSNNVDDSTPVQVVAAAALSSSDQDEGTSVAVAAVGAVVSDASNNETFPVDVDNNNDDEQIVMSSTLYDTTVTTAATTGDEKDDHVSPVPGEMVAVVDNNDKVAAAAATSTTTSNSNSDDGSSNSNKTAFQDTTKTNDDNDGVNKSRDDNDNVSVVVANDAAADANDVVANIAVAVTTDSDDTATTAIATTSNSATATTTANVTDNATVVLERNVDHGDEKDGDQHGDDVEENKEISTPAAASPRERGNLSAGVMESDKASDVASHGDYDHVAGTIAPTITADIIHATEAVPVTANADDNSVVVLEKHADHRFINEHDDVDNVDDDKAVSTPADALPETDFMETAHYHEHQSSVAPAANDHAYNYHDLSIPATALQESKSEIADLQQKHVVAADRNTSAVTMDDQKNEEDDNNIEAADAAWMSMLDEEASPVRQANHASMATNTGAGQTLTCTTTRSHDDDEDEEISVNTADAAILTPTGTNSANVHQDTNVNPVATTATTIVATLSASPPVSPSRQDDTAATVVATRVAVAANQVEAEELPSETTGAAIIDKGSIDFKPIVSTPPKNQEPLPAVAAVTTTPPTTETTGDSNSNIAISQSGEATTRQHESPQLKQAPTAQSPKSQLSTSTTSTSDPSSASNNTIHKIVSSSLDQIQEQMNAGSASFSNLEKQLNEQLNVGSLSWKAVVSQFSAAEGKQEKDVKRKVDDDAGDASAVKSVWEPTIGSFSWRSVVSQYSTAQSVSQTNSASASNKKLLSPLRTSNNDADHHDRPTLIDHFGATQTTRAKSVTAVAAMGEDDGKGNNQNDNCSDDDATIDSTAAAEAAAAAAERDVQAFLKLRGIVPATFERKSPVKETVTALNLETSSTVKEPAVAARVGPFKITSLLDESPKKAVSTSTPNIISNLEKFEKAAFGEDHEKVVQVVEAARRRRQQEQQQQQQPGDGTLLGDYCNKAQQPTTSTSDLAATLRRRAVSPTRIPSSPPASAKTSQPTVSSLTSTPPVAGLTSGDEDGALLSSMVKTTQTTAKRESSAFDEEAVPRSAKSAVVAPASSDSVRRDAAEHGDLVEATCVRVGETVESAVAPSAPVPRNESTGLVVPAQEAERLTEASSSIACPKTGHSVPESRTTGATIADDGHVSKLAPGQEGRLHPEQIDQQNLPAASTMEAALLQHVVTQPNDSVLAAAQKIGDVKQPANKTYGNNGESYVAESLLTSLDLKEYGNDVRNIFRQQHGFSEAGKQPKASVDFSSVSSVASTISPGSTIRGTETSGLISPLVGDDSVSQRNRRTSLGSGQAGSVDLNKPPLFPRKGGLLGEHNPGNLVELVSRKLAGHTDSDRPDADVDTGFIKKKQVESFDPKESVFAFMDGVSEGDDASHTSSLGSCSPPEPDTDFDDDVLSLDSQVNSFSGNARQEVAVWDMISAKHGAGGTSKDEERGKPEFVVMPASDADGVEQWGQASFHADTAGQGISKPHRPLANDMSMTSTGRKHRGVRRRLSGSGHQPLSGRAIIAKRKGVYRLDKYGVCRVVRSEELPVVFSPEEEKLHRSSSMCEMSPPRKKLEVTCSKKSTSCPDFRILSKTHASMLQCFEETPIQSKARSRAMSADGEAPESSRSSVKRLSLTAASLEASPEHCISRQQSLITGSPASHSQISFPTATGTSPDQINLEFGEEESVKHNEESLLEESLRKLSSVDRLEFPFRNTATPSSLSYIADIRWKQLLANWKHAQIVTLMLSRYPSKHFFGKTESPDAVLDPVVDSTAAFIRVANLGPQLEIDLRGGKGPIDPALDPWKNRDGFGPFHCERALHVHSRFLSSFGGPRADGAEVRNVATVKVAEDPKIVESLYSAATSYKDDFERVIRDMAAFAAENISGTTNPRSPFSLSFSVDVKDRLAIERKAKRKYGGNALLVKDILRGQIVFPDEGSLVCGILQLHKFCKSQEDEEATKPPVKTTVVRMKNLFYTSSPLGVLPSSPLPTGYRHILFNIQLEGKSTGKIIAEIQCHLAPLYFVLESAGCALHRDIQELECLLDRNRNGDVSIEPDPQIQTTEPQPQAKLAENGSPGEEQKIAIEGVVKASTNAPSANRTVETESPFTTLESQLESKETNNLAGRKDNLARNPFDMNELISSICAAPLANVELDGQLPRRSSSHIDDNKTPLRSNVGFLVCAPAMESPQDHPASPMKPKTIEPLAPRTPMASNLDLDENRVQAMETPPDGAGTPTQSKTCTANGEVSIAELETPKAGRALRPAHDAPDSINKEDGDCDLLAALIGCGARTVWEDPRDAGSFNCLFSVLSFVLRQDGKARSQAKSVSGTVPSEELVELSRACVRRCLELGDQSTCTGMTGWVEHQLSGPLRRMSTETPFTLLHHLACSYGRDGNWIDAEAVFSALLLRSEQNFPLYHPTVLIALLDLAAVSVKNSKHHLAKSLVSRVADRLASYLAEIECSHMGHLEQCAVVSRPGGYLCQMDEGRDALSMLKAFVEGFQSYLHRDLVDLIGTNHEIVLIHRTFLGDAYAVLANCTTASNTSFGRADSEADSSASFWGLAFVHYRAAFQGFVESKGLEDPSTACSAYGAARCLRELGETEKAMTVLSTVAKALFDRAAEESNQTDQAEATHADENFPRKGRPFTFLPSASLRRSMSSHRIETKRLISSALCYWLMAVLAADSQQDEEGRVRALKLLHKASVSLQRSLKLTPTDDDSSRTTCIELLRKIEDEAKSILQPIGPMPADSFQRRGQRPHKRLSAVH